MKNIVCQICTQDIKEQKVHLCAQCKIAIKLEYDKLMKQTRTNNYIFDMKPPCNLDSSLRLFSAHVC